MSTGCGLCHGRESGGAPQNGRLANVGSVPYAISEYRHQDVGQSTLLPALGLNAVLAHAGIPVSAKNMAISRFSICASLTIPDSLFGAGWPGRKMHMASNDDNDPLHFDYKLKPGVTTQSSALAIAKLAGIAD